MTNTPLKPCPDAVEALTATLEHLGQRTYLGTKAHYASVIIDELSKRGFTITRAAAPMTAEHFNVRNFIEQNGDPKLLAEFDTLMGSSQPPMTDAELEREAKEIMRLIKDGYDDYELISDIAKKYRG